MTNTGDGIVLVGEAAKSWVTLQWTKWIWNELLIAAIIIAGVYVVYKLWQEYKNESEKGVPK